MSADVDELAWRWDLTGRHGIWGSGQDGRGRHVRNASSGRTAAQVPGATIRPIRASVGGPAGGFIPLTTRAPACVDRIAPLMLNEARIGLLLLSALTAGIAPACGRSFKRAEPTEGEASRRAGPRLPQTVDALRSQTSHVTWPISSSSKG